MTASRPHLALLPTSTLAQPKRGYAGLAALANAQGPGVAPGPVAPGPGGKCRVNTAMKQSFLQILSHCIQLSSTEGFVVRSTKRHDAVLEL